MNRRHLAVAEEGLDGDVEGEQLRSLSCRDVSNAVHN